MDLKRCSSSPFKGTILKFTEWEGAKKPWLGQLYCKRSVEMGIHQMSRVITGWLTYMLCLTEICA
jgi:hypothetical protein